MVKHSWVFALFLLAGCGSGANNVTAPPAPPPPPPTTLLFVISSSTSSSCTFGTSLTLREAGPGRTLGYSARTLAPGQADTIHAPANSPHLAILEGSLSIAVYPYDVPISQSVSVPGGASYSLTGC